MTIRLTWQEGAPDSSGDGYKIYRSVNGGAYSLIATLSLSTTQYDDSSVSVGNLYSYRVVEYSGSEESQAAEITVRISAQSVSASEGRSLRASLSRNQALGGIEVRSIGAQLSRTQTVYSSEILSLSSLLQRNEAIASEDYCALACYLFPADDISLAEQHESRATVIANETFSLYEAPHAEAHILSDDQGLAEENRALYRQLAAEDVGNIADLLSPVYATLALSDALLPEEAVALSSYLGRLDQGSVFEGVPIIGVSSEDSVEAAEAQDLHNRLARQDAGVPEERVSLLCSLLAVDEALASETLTQSAQLSRLDASALTEAKEFLSALLGSDDQLGCLESLRARAYLASWDSFALEEAKALSAALSRSDVFSALELSDLLALIELLDIVSAYETGGLLISCGDLVFALEQSGLQAVLTGYDCGQIDDVWLGFAFFINEAIDSQEASCVYFRQFGQPWGWFSYKVEGMPSPEVKVPQVLGQKGQPGKKKLANPQAIKVG